MESEKGIHIGFACFDLPNDLHITIGRHFNASPETLALMQQFVDERLKPLLPFHIIFGNYCKVGENFDVPAYKVKFIYERQREVLEEFYAAFYNEAPGKRIWALPKYHITCDTPAKLEDAERLIRAVQVPPMYALRDLSFKSRVEGGHVQIGPTGDWICPVCHQSNNAKFKVCGTDGCDQWRPKELSPEVPIRAGDWSCVCGFRNFASRDSCKNCSLARLNTYVPQLNPDRRPWVCPRCAHDNSPDDVQCFGCMWKKQFGQFSVIDDRSANYNQPPSAPPSRDLGIVPQEVVKESRLEQKSQGRQPDWWCSKCQFKVFGSKDRCKCGRRRP